MLIYDVEVSTNRAMVGFMDVDTKEITQFESTDSAEINTFIHNRGLVGFNSNKYDDVILDKMINGARAREIYSTSVHLIDGEGRAWDYNPTVKSIDLIEVAPGQAGLKLYGTRLNTKRLQDLPYDPHKRHSKKMWKNVWDYNKIDLQVTLELYEFLDPQLNLREQIGLQYGIDVMSKSDPQIAEAIFKRELGIQNLRPPHPPKSIRYTAPDAVKFRSPELRDLVKRIEDTEIELSKGGSPLMPKWLKDEVIKIGDTTYNIGLGGLHSMEKSMAVIGKLGNVDVASMYPSLIITMGLFPKQLGVKFLDVYTTIRDTRMDAKHRGDKVIADTLKIVLNGSYGKFGSMYSFLYAPDLMLQVTFTGQLYLLMLIEAFENAGVRVVSANTDGIEYVRSKDVRKMVSKWERRTGLEMEYGEYNALYARDVNSYIAVYDGYVKAKGFYGEPDISKNPEYPIVTEAIRQFLSNGTPLEEVILECKDPAEFCISRKVNGGGLWNSKDYPNTEEYDNYIAKGLKKNMALEKRNENYQKQFLMVDREESYLGRVVRFYYSTKGKPMYYATSGNRVPKSNGCRPMMKLKKRIPKDLDYSKYIQLAEQHLKELGYEN